MCIIVFLDVIFLFSLNAFSLSLIFYQIHLHLQVDSFLLHLGNSSTLFLQTFNVLVFLEFLLCFCKAALFFPTIADYSTHVSVNHLSLCYWDSIILLISDQVHWLFSHRQSSVKHGKKFHFSYYNFVLKF